MSYSDAVRFLRRNDRNLRRVIDEVGDCRLRVHGARFSLLARSILSQQISVSAARTIRRQLQRQLPGGRLSAPGLLALGDRDFQQAGVSRQKREYLRNLAALTADGTLSFRRMKHQSDEDVIAQLTQVKGVGTWTAQMFLIFGLGRPDVFAPADTGLQNAVRQIYPQTDLSLEDLTTVSDRWRPWRSVASWYLWRFLDSQPDS